MKNTNNFLGHLDCWRMVLLLASVVLVCLFGPALVSAAAAEKSSSPAKCEKVAGLLLAGGEGKAWQAVKAGEPVPADTLLVALPGAELRSRNGAVDVTLLVDLGQRGPFPVLESAIKLRNHPQADLEVGLERGIVLLGNAKSAGTAKVVLAIRHHRMELALREPGSKIAVEIISRHLPGAPRLLKPPDPHINVMFLAATGRIFLRTDQQGQELRAPPGPAMLLWDSLTKTSELKRLEELPLKPKDPEALENKVFREICLCTETLQDKNFAQAFQDLIQANNTLARGIGVVGLGAVDEVAGLIDALTDKDHADVRDKSVLVLRHWLGRSAGQLPRLFKVLAKEKGYTKIQAYNILHLLLGFTEQQRADAATFDFLISLLEHDKLAFRELARWHLVRLAPAGKDIPYDAAAPAADRKSAVARWRDLIPPGQLPPPPVRGNAATK